MNSSGNFTSLLNPSIVLMGRANAGKSTLFNKLLKKKRSLVTSTEGTTRDYISEYIFFEGTHFRLLDTAGMRGLEDKALNSAEREGIQKALELQEEAFYRFYVCNPFQGGEKNIHGYPYEGLVLTHADCEGFEEKLKTLYSEGSFHHFRMPKTYTSSPKGGIAPIEAATFFQSGSIEPLRSGTEEVIFSSIAQKYQKETSRKTFITMRQKNKIVDLWSRFQEFQKLREGIHDFGILSHEVDALTRGIDDLIGVIVPDDILDHVFSGLCIGK